MACNRNANRLRRKPLAEILWLHKRGNNNKFRLHSIAENMYDLFVRSEVQQRETIWSKSKAYFIFCTIWQRRIQMKRQ